MSGAAVELALGSYPGFHVTAPPGKGAPYGVFEAAYVAVARSSTSPCCRTGHGRPYRRPGRTGSSTRWRSRPCPNRCPPVPPVPSRSAGLAGARSGDKGGDANVGVWVRSDDAWRWLAHELTVARFRELLPETAGLTVVRHVLPRLRALNFVVHGLLGEGVAAQARFDPQAKALGEWLRSRHVTVPVQLPADPEVHA